MKLSLLRALGLVLCAVVCLASAARAEDEAQDKEEPRRMAPRFERWLERDVRWIISDIERDVFLSLGTDQERDKFVKSFWDSRDPTPGTRRNEARQEHYKRLEYAERQLGRDSARPGYLTDRGRVYILLGEPGERKFFFSSAYNTYPMELWWYQTPKELEKRSGLPSFFWVLFFKKRGAGEFKLYSPIGDGPENLVGGSRSNDRLTAVEALLNVHRELAQASLSLVPSEPVDIERGGTSTAAIASEMLLSKLHDLPNRTVEPQYLERFGGVTGRSRSEVAFVQFQAPLELLTSLDRGGVPWLHLSLEVPPGKLTLYGYEDAFAATLNLLGTVESEDGRTIEWLNEPLEVALSREQFSRVKTSPMSVETMIPVIPGRHTLRVILRNEVTGQFGVAEAPFETPSRPAEGILISRPLLAYDIDPTRQSAQPVPFAFADVKLSPATGGVLARGENAYVYFQIHYPVEASPGRITKMVSLERNGEEVSGQLGFLEANPSNDGGLLHVVEELKVKELQPGDYDLVVRIADADRVTLGEARAPLKLTLDRVPRPWTYVKRSTRSDPRRTLARQHVLAGTRDQAVSLLRALVSARPQDGALRLDLAEALVGLGRYSEALEQLDSPAMAQLGSSWLALSLRAASEMGLGRYAEAASHYREALKGLGPDPRLLNALGEAYQKAGDTDQARQAFIQSLKLNASQPTVRQVLEQLGGIPPELQEPETPEGEAAG